MFRHAHLRWTLVIAVVATATACTRGQEPNVSPLQAQKAQLERELEGLRESVALLDQGTSIFPPSDIAIGIDQTLVRRLISGVLPFTIKVDPYTLLLDKVEVSFMGAPTVRLHGRVTRAGLLTLDGAATALGSLTDIEVDATSSTLGARISFDHLEIHEAAGLETLLSGSTLDDVAGRIRKEAASQLPALAIPVRVQQDFTLPAVTDGPVRLEAARLPVGARVSRVFATEGRLWVAIHLTLGSFTRTGAGS